MLTTASLHKRLKFLADATPLTRRPSKTAFGETGFKDGAATINVSPLCPDTGDSLSNEAQVATYLHELIHVALAAELAAFGAFEEAVVSAIEKTMYDFVCARPSRLKWWVARLGAA